MKKIYTLCALLTTLIFSNHRALATHAAGMDLTYTCFGNNQYQFVATFYRDCGGIQAPLSVPLDLSSISCNYSDNFNMNLVFTTQGSDTISHLAGLCPNLDSECIGGTYQGYEQYIYAATVTLPYTCDDWLAATHVSSRNNAITNLLDPGIQDLYVECYFSNVNNMCNNSPLFTTIPLAYSCINELFVYNHGAYDPDGDSLVYTLVNPLNAHNDPIDYSNLSLNPQYPMFTVSGTFDFDPLTGQMSCIPNSAQIVVISVLIDEYRNGVKIASAQRDLQIVVKTCSNNVPEIPDGIENVVGGFLVDSNTVQVCPGATLDFDLIGLDIDVLNSLTMTTSLPIIIPAATYTVTGVNPDTMHIHWETTTADTGFYVFTVTIKDDGCPISGQQIYSFTIQVAAPQADAGPDITVCESNPVTALNVVGLEPFLWNNPQYLDDPTVTNPVATLPGVPGTYEFIVTANVGGYCQKNDTVLVIVQPEYISGADAIPDTLCAGEEVILNGSASGGVGNYTYDWSSIPAGLSSNQASTTDNPEVPTQYILTTTSGTCIHHDTINVYARPLPNASFTMDSTLCEGQIADISYTGGAGNTYDYIWSFENGTFISGSGSGPYQLTWDTSGIWEVTLVVTDDFNCSDSKTISVVVSPNPVIDFTSEVGGCEPYTVTFDNNSSGAVTYEWDFGDGTTSNESDPTHTYSAGLYTVTLTGISAAECTTSLTFTDYIEVLPVPIACADVQEDISIVYDVSQATFHFIDCSQFATEWHWDFGDGTSSTEQHPTHSYTSVDTFYVILTAANKYCSDTMKIGPIITVFWDDVFFPSAFSPNNDGWNDFFHEVGGLGLTSLYYAVYDRWGELIFETNDMNSQGWNGRFENEDCEVGVYVWLASAGFVNGTVISQKGNVTLVR